MIALAAAALLAALPTSSAPRAVTLDEAVRMARTGHPGVRAARARADAAGARADEARGALLPQLGAGAGWQWQERRGAGLPSSAGGAWSGQATADQLVWDFGRSGGAWRAARLSAGAEAAAADEAAVARAREARAAWLEARAGRELAAVAAEQVRAAEAQLARVEALVETGARPASDLARARSDLAQARLARVQADQRHAVGRAALRAAIGAGEGEWDAGGDDLPPVPGEDAPADALLTEAAAARPALREVELLIAAQDATLAAARGTLLPRLGVGATAGAAGERLDGLERTWTAGVSLSWSLFEGGAGLARVREAGATRSALAAQRDAAHQALRAELATALAAVAGGREAVSAARDAAAAAEEDLRLAAGRYDVGAGTLLDVSTARAATFSALGQVVAAERDLGTARADLLAAMGRG